MQAMVLERPARIDDLPLIFSEIPTPTNTETEVLVKVAVCGVCHTDLHIVEGELTPTFLPIIPGHQVVGEIAAIGIRVEGWNIGDRVGIPWLNSTCESCDYCEQGQENLCQKACFTGLHVNGGFAEYIVAKPDYLVRLPVNINDQQAALLLCAGIIGYRSVRIAGVKPGDTVALAGFGTSAHLVIQLLNHWKCKSFVFTRSTTHKEHARRLGAEWIGEIGQDAPTLADCAISFTPDCALVPTLLKQIKPGGTVAINAIHASDIPGFSYELLYGERKISSVTNATRKDAHEFMLLAQETGIRSDVSKYQLVDANRALSDLKYSRIRGGAILCIS